MTSRYRVLDKDNFDGEGPSSTQRFVTEPLPLDMCEVIAEALNERFGGYMASRYFCAVPEDHKLFIFEP